MTESEISQLIKDVETGGMHWDKYSIVKALKQVIQERDEARLAKERADVYVDQLLQAVAYGRQP